MKLARMLDGFAKPPTLYYRGQAKISSIRGLLCTTLIFIILLVLFVHDAMTHPEARATQFKKIKNDPAYEYNPFTENAISLSFGI